MGGDELAEKLESLRTRTNLLNPRVADEVKGMIFAHWNMLLNVMDECQSPIEQLLAAHIDEMAMKQCFDYAFTVIPQYPVVIDDDLTFHVDLLVRADISGKRVQVAVECDGHEFHEKTKQQAAGDKRRDRLIQSKGISVLRFTGSEIWNDPPQCAFDIVSCLEAQAEGHKG